MFVFIISVNVKEMMIYWIIFLITFLCWYICNSHGVRDGLKTGIEKAVGDSQVKSVVIIGKGRTFPAGADIREFGKPSRGIKERERERENVKNRVQKCTSL